MQLRTGFAVFQIGQQNHNPHENEADAGNRGYDGEHIHDVAALVEQENRHDKINAGIQQSGGRHAVAVQLGKHFRCHIGGGQAVQHAAGGEHAAVGRGQCGSEHHQIHQTCGNRNADKGKHVHERAFGRIHFAPRRYRHNHAQRQHIKYDNADGDAVDGFGQVGFRVFGFRSRRADQFNADKGKYGDLEGGEEAADAVREKAAFVPQVRKRSFFAGRRINKAGKHQEQTNHHQQQNGDDFNQCEPKFHFAEQFHREQVHACHNHDTEKPGQPQRHIRPPKLRVARNGDDVGHADNHPAEPIGPTHKETGGRTQQIVSEIGERFIFQI